MTVLLDQISVRPAGPGRYHVAATEPMFGGTVLAQAMSAAVQSAPGLRPHSLHGYFLRRALPGQRITYRVDALRSGRTFLTLDVRGSQGDRSVFAGVVSFHAVTSSDHDYQRDLLPDVPGPDEGVDMGVPWPVDVRMVGPTEPTPDGRYASTFRAWLRARDPLPEDPGVHAAVLAFLSDISGRGARPPHLDPNDKQLVSLDHALWLHVPAAADQWLLYDVTAVVNAEGRALIRGTMHDAGGRLVATVAQELIY